MVEGDRTVLVERRGPVAVFTWNRPARLNAWTDPMEDEYFDALRDADEDPQVRAIVVTGAGRGFCAGADLDGLKNVSDTTASDLRRPRPRDYPMSVRKPLVGAVNGVAAGLGFVEALYCDVRFGCSASRFTTAFAKRGLIAEYGIAWLLPRVIGHSRAADLLLSSRVVEGEEALRIGLLDHLVDDPLESAVGYARDIADQCSPRSLAVIKSQLARDTDSTYSESTSRAEALMLEAFHGPDVVEGMSSHLERRPPNFPPPVTRSNHVPL